MRSLNYNGRTGLISLPFVGLLPGYFVTISESTSGRPGVSKPRFRMTEIANSCFREDRVVFIRDRSVVFFVSDALDATCLIVSAQDSSFSLVQCALTMAGTDGG